MKRILDLEIQHFYEYITFCLFHSCYSSASIIRFHVSHLSSPGKLGLNNLDINLKFVPFQIYISIAELLATRLDES